MQPGDVNEAPSGATYDPTLPSPTMITLSDYAIKQALDVLLRHSVGSDVSYDFAQSGSELSVQESMKSLQAEANLLESLVTAFQRGALKKVAGIRRQHNSLTPINHLPVEILSIIFQIVQDSEIAEEEYYGIERLAEVSSYWRSVISANIHLRSVLDSRCPLPLVKNILKMSKNRPLEIRVSDGHIQETENFLKLVSPYLQRWKSLEMPSKKYTEVAWYLRYKTSIDWLESFKVTGRYLGIEPPDIIMNRAPRLHSLSIIPFKFPLSASAFKSLRNLEFTPETGGLEVWSDQWQRLLSTSSRLEFIRVRGDRPITRIENLIPLFPVVLPKLQKIVLEELRAQLVGALISSICTLPTEHALVEIVNPSYMSSASGEPFPISPQSNSLLWSIRSMVWMEVLGDRHHGRVSIRAGMEGGHCILVFNQSTHPISQDATFDQLISATGLPDLRSLYLDGTSFSRPGIVVGAFWCLPQLTSLDLRNINLTGSDLDTGHHQNHVDLVKEACIKLSEKPADDHMDGVWLLPQLKELRLPGLNQLGEVIHLLFVRRYGWGSSPPATDLPIPLDVLELTSFAGMAHLHENVMDSVLMGNLRDILDSGGTRLVITPIELDKRGSFKGQGFSY